MKQIVSLLLFCLSLLIFIACANSDSYEKKLDAEKALVSDFIKNNNINVIGSLPANNAWGENDYYKTDDDFYIHIVDTGEIGTEVKTAQLVLARYYKINLIGDTILRKWTTSDATYPEEITYALGSPTPSYGIQKAISIMKRHNSEAKFIVPSKLGNDIDANAVTPYFYHLKIKLTE